MLSSSERAERTVLALWVLVVVVMPLAITWVGAFVEPGRGVAAQDAHLLLGARVIAAAMARGVLLSALAVVLAWPVARSVPTPWLIASAVVPVASRAYGVLALGAPPGLAAYSLTHVTATVPLAALVLQLRRNTLPTGALEAARELGASPWQRWSWIELPHMAPAIAIAMLWSLCQSLGDVVNGTIAGGGRVYGPGLMIRDAIHGDPAPLRVAVMTTTMCLLAAMVGFWIVREFLEVRRRGSTGVRRGDTTGSAPRPWIGAGLHAAMLVPLVGLVFGLSTPSSARSSLALWDSLGTTIVDAGAAALPAVVIAVVLAIAVLDRGSAGWGGMLLVPIVLPSALVGAVAASCARLAGVRPGLLLTTCAHLVHAVSLACVFILVSAASIPPDEPAAARDLGAGWWTRARWLWWPALSPVAAVAAILVMALVVFDPSISSFTAGPGGTTMAVVLATIARSGDVASLDAALLVAAALPFVLVASLPRTITGSRGARHDAP